MPRYLKIGICQHIVTGHKQENLCRAAHMVARAASAGCHIVTLPEMFNCPYSHSFFETFAEAYPEGETFEMLRRSAQEQGVYLVGGTIPEIDKGKLYNTSFVFSPRGKLIGKQRKLHLFNVHLDTFSFQESATFTPGQSLILFNTDVAVFGIAICFDLRFPEVFQMLAARGAEIVFIPAAFNTTTGPVHWELLIRARAVDYQLYTIGCSAARNPQSHFTYYAHSLACDPWSNVLVAAQEQETLLTCELDLELIKEVRTKLPLVRNYNLKVTKEYFS